MDSRRILGILDGLSLVFLDPGKIFGILDGSIGISSDPVDYCLLYLILEGFLGFLESPWICIGIVWNLGGLSFAILSIQDLFFEMPSLKFTETILVGFFYCRTYRLFLRVDYRSCL